MTNSKNNKKMMNK